MVKFGESLVLLQVDKADCGQVKDPSLPPATPTQKEKVYLFVFSALYNNITYDSKKIPFGQKGKW